MQTSETRRIPILWGALIGLLATVPLAAIFYAAKQIIYTPEPAVDFFDRLSRILPGGLITFGIDSMVAIFSKLPNVPTDVASKAAERSLGIGLFLFGGLVFGALIAFILSRTRRSIAAAYVGAGVALIPLLLTLIVENFNSGNANGALVAGSWLLLAYGVWGTIVGSTLERFAAPANASSVTASAPVAVSGVSGVPVPVIASRTAVASPARRNFLIQFGGSAAVLTLLSWGAGRLLGQSNTPPGQPVANLPTATPMPPGQAGGFVAAPGTRLEVTPNNQFYRVDINTDPSRIDPQTYKLTVGGLVDKPLTFSYDELRKLPAAEQDATLECISNPVGGGLISSTHWTGVKLADVLKSAGVQSGVTEIRFLSADGYNESIPLASAMDERTLLAYATNGEALAPEHGYPLRLYTPDRYGMKNPKWITSIEAINSEEVGYWRARGWDRDAFVKSTSVIDTIDVNDAKDGIVPVGGIAFAGARQISKVEVSVDSGDWQAVQLKDPISPLTWRFWRFDWKAPKGFHTLVVRTTDGKGAPQIQEEAPLHPTGASGYVSKTVTIM